MFRLTWLSTGVYAITALILISCSTKHEALKVQLSGNRVMGVYLKKVETKSGSPVGPEIHNYFRDLIVSSLNTTYSPKIEVLQFVDGGLLESPHNLYKIAEKSIDDLFVMEVRLPTNFEIPSPAPMDEENTISPLAEPVIVSGTIVNGEKLRAVTALQFSADTAFKEEFEKTFSNNFEQNALNVFQNPNVYPKSDPQHFANLLYVYSHKLETESEEALNCNNAKAVLQHYSQARELYVRAKEQQTEMSSVGQQERIHELNNRIDETTKKANILEACKNDEALGFSVEFDFGKISPENHAVIIKAFEHAKLEVLLKRYTQKPVKLQFKLDESGDLSLSVRIRFDQARYKAWTRGRVPEVDRGYHIISFDPYYALMQTLVYFKYALPAEASKPLRNSFQRMNISLILDTLLNGYAIVGVTGQYIANEKTVKIGYPNNVVLSTPSFETLTISTRSNEIFQDKGWMALSSCKTLDGTITEDGLLMRFFGLPCKI